jgi:hypothetical protein
MSWPGDERRHVDLNVFFVHVPLPSAGAARATENAN